MGRLLDFLLIVIVILWIIKALVRFLLPMLFQSVVNKAQDQHQNQQHNYSSQRKPDEKVKVDYIPEGNKQKVPDSEGEFIDYEEIK
jgi:flagellar basal body-associated protein FliL